MTTPLRFFVDGKPQPKKRPVTVRLKGDGRIVTFTPKETVKYEGLIRTHALRASRLQLWPRPTESDRFHLLMLFYFHDERRQDLDNFAKAVLDGMNPLGSLHPQVYLDDSQVASFETDRILCSGRPGVYIEVQRRGERRGLSHIDVTHEERGAL